MTQDMDPQQAHQQEIERLDKLYAVLAHVNQAIVRMPTQADLFHTVCRVLVEQGGFRMAWVGWCNPETAMLEPVAQHGDVQGYLQGIRIYTDTRPEGMGPVGTALREERSYICNDIFNDPATQPWREAARRSGFLSSGAFVVRMRGAVVGALSVYALERDYFQDKEVALLLDVAADISFALDNYARREARRHADAAVAEYARQLQAMSRQLLEVQENERRLLARELHDSVGQELTALSLNLTMIRNALPSESVAQLGPRLEDSQRLLEDTTKHLRHVMVTLRPPGLDELGLLAAVKDHAQRVAQRSGFTLMVHGSEPRPRLPPTVEIALFRIVQEALNNTVKHAQATDIAVTVEGTADQVRLCVADNGRGFDPERRAAAGTASGMGMTTMRERAEAVGAAFAVQSASGKGTTITIDVARPG
jgi:signal transduction histidine kinase